MSEALFLKQGDKLITVAKQHVTCVIRVNEVKTTILLTNGRDMHFDCPYSGILESMGWGDAAIEAGHISQSDIADE